jgi:3-oxoacyl-[acyl-carrier protein] reductase
MHINLKQRVAIVTGAAQGIGKAIAEKLAGEGVRLSLWDMDRERLNDTAEAIVRDISADVVAVGCDVKVPADVERAASETLKRLGRIDILVANAGIARPRKFLEISPEEWDEIFNTNTRGVFLCAKAVAPHLKKQNSGRIIIASSFAAIVPSVGSAAYAASKSALVSLTRVLAAELGPWNITVNSYAPGMIPSNMSGIDQLPAERREMMLDSLSLREWGRAEDVASLVVFLASDQARYITGAHIDASGGKFAVQFAKLAREE